MDCPQYDLAIIGLGPAGATLAGFADKNLRVIAIDKKDDRPQSFEKPCGGLLAPDAQKTLAHFRLTLPLEILVKAKQSTYNAFIFSKRYLWYPYRLVQTQ